MPVKIILTDSYDFFKQNFGQIATLCMPFLIIDEFIKTLLIDNQNSLFLSSISFIALYPIYTAALIIFMSKTAKKQQSKNFNLIISSLKLYWPFFILTIASVFLSSVGFFLLIIPGIWILTRLAFAEFFLVLYDKNPIEAIRHSFALTKQHFWLLISFVLTYLCIFQIFDFLIDHTINNFFLIVIANSFCAYIMLYFDVALFRLFMAAVPEKPIT